MQQVTSALEPAHARGCGLKRRDGSLDQAVALQDQDCIRRSCGEGTFRQAVVVKRRNRDTAWFSILDSEWPALKRAYERWLAPENFDDAGIQRRRLGDFIHHSDE